MPRTPTPRPIRRPSGGERVFADEAGRLWSAAPAPEGEAAVIFTCISDSRQSARALAIDASFRLTDVADETLRAWLRDAPRIGRLT